LTLDGITAFFRQAHTPGRILFVVAVALANKTARIAWAVMHRHGNCRREGDRAIPRDFL
jgi:hypothetical protein